VPMTFGHSSSSQRKRAASWNGGDPQVLNLQVDLGSSDMVSTGIFMGMLTFSGWLVPIARPPIANPHRLSSMPRNLSIRVLPCSFSITQATSVERCIGSRSLLGTSASDIKLSVSVSGAFALTSVAANDVTDEDLGGANFTGVLGLACRSFQR
jgi:hypothetical protein